MNNLGKQEEDLFNAARQLTDPRHRAAFLEAVCSNDAELRRRLDELFASQPEAEAFFETSAGGARAATQAAAGSAQTVRAPTDEATGTLIGCYKLLQKIGDGGFGAVYMADQKEPVKRQVALKIIKLGMDTRQVVARFEAERQALALMEHPNIAKVFDAGATESGRPYFVMELVRGQPITQYCEENNLAPVERLKLFIQVCRAIQHAHQKGIIHRDIKPSNILVTLHDGVPVPKVIDFGIAKATQQELTEKTLFTQFHQFMGTPAYMSPEQAERSGVDIDTRSDIYSLGVLLYELLTGKTPFDGKSLLAAGLDEMRRTIREKEPVRPSTRLTQELVAAEVSRPASPGGKPPTEDELKTHSRRRLRLRETITLLRGDLDWIVMKALDKDRTRRYETANGMALDIQRHLGSQPVEARPPSQLYRLQKFARRNKLALIPAGLIVALLVFGVIATVSQAVRAKKAEQRARRTAYIAEMNSAGHALSVGNIGRARELLAHHVPAGQLDLRGWEWRYLANATRGEQQQRLIGHTEGITGLCFLGDSQLLSVAWDHRAIWWDAGQGRELRTLVISNSTVGLAVAPGHHLAALADNHPSAGVGGVSLLDLDRHLESPTPFHRPNSDNTLFDFAPSGELAIMDADEPGVLTLCDANSGKRLAIFEGGTNEYNCLRFSPDGRQLAAATRAGWIQIWDVASRTNLFSWLAHTRDGGFAITVNTLAFSPNGRQLVSAGIDGLVVVWDSETGAQLQRLDGLLTPVSEVAFSTDGHWLAAASLDHVLYVWETGTWTRVKSFHGHSAGVRRVVWSANGRLLASGDLSGEVLLWAWPPRTNSEERIEFSTLLEPNLSETGDTLLRHGGGTNPIVEFWDTKSLHLTASYPTPDTNIVSGWLLPGGHLIATGDQAGRVGIWEVASRRELLGINAHKSKIYGIIGSANGQVIVTLSVDGEAMVWDLPALTLRLQFHPEQPFDGRAVTADGSCMAIGHLDGRIELRDLRSGERRTIWKARGVNFKALTFSPDGKLLASSSWDRTGRLWDVQQARIVRTIGGNLLTFESLAFSPDGSRLAAGTGEGTVKLYDVATAEEVATYTGHRRPVYAVSFLRDGTDLVSVSADALCTWHAPGIHDLKAVETQLVAHRPHP